ncbi:hypothetical protein [Erythrobacter litoralis]|uniref:Uncharacterized protein n=1 Tax=Erythrobacter litoralis (strain HTCC2594) TaxID=314225 RepID=Q2N8H0_ERYLH|nr:hypothetical protein [Erythrobacter litoralis]ABC64021.1 hypothetical protein ELI_09645 [Erythrobacter litoralis HTCC2594]
MSTQDPDGTIHIEDDEAMAGEKSGHMRWVLGISLILAIVAMTLVWIIPAMQQGDAEEEATLSGRLEAEMDDEGDDTDGIIEPEEFGENGG